MRKDISDITTELRRQAELLEVEILNPSLSSEATGLKRHQRHVLLRISSYIEDPHAIAIDLTL